MNASLHASFVAAVGDAYAIAPHAVTRLAHALAARFGEARESWPGVVVSGADFAAYLAERVPDDGDPGAALGQMRVADLYLACACTLGVDGAAEAFERKIMPAIPKAIARIDSTRSFIDDVASIVRVKLLVGDESRPPRVASYLGRGPLSAFAQMVALREAQSLKRRRVREEPFDRESLLEVPFETDDPELAEIKAQLREPFQRAFRGALDDLSARERNVLRLYLVEDVGRETIARMYKVHRATVARWVADARDAVLLGTRKRLMGDLALSRSSCDSVVGKLATQLDVSLLGFLGTD